MKALIQYSALALMLLATASCQKVINVKLNSSAQQYVIQGTITDAPGPYTITISRTKDFSADNTFDQVSGAQVTVMDSTAGTTETLQEVSPGHYNTATITGTPGHTYKLSVTVAGLSFTAASTMPAQAVALDSLYAGHSAFGGDDIFMTPVFTDPVGKGNYYLLRQTVRDSTVQGTTPRRDEATDGQVYNFQLYYDTGDKSGNPKIHNGDSISVELQCVDKKVYDYYRTLLDVTGASNTATPANPLTNITGGALGIFNACTSRRKSAIAVY